VWALAPFMTAYDHVGTSATNAVGLANAFSTAAVLANVASGTVPGYAAPAGSVVPTAEINTLANIMASCINTAGGVAGDGSACGKLYGYTTVGSSVPANTVGAMLNEAKNPALNGLPYALVQNPTSPFYLLVSGTGPYQPALSAAPTDWTIAVSYPTGGSGVPFNDLFTQTIAIDSNGDAFIVDTKALHELSPAGLNIGNNLTMGGSSVGLDATGDIWVGGYTGTPSPGYFLEAASIVSEPTRSSIGSPGVGANDVTSFSFDPNGSMWYACDYCSAMYGPKGAVGAASDFHGTFAVVDQSGNAWHGDSAGILSVVNSNGVPIGGSPYKNLSSGGVGLTSSSLAIAAAIDSNGFAWISGGNCLLKATTTGSFTFVGGPTGSLLSGIYAPFGIAVDGANNVWAANPQNAFYSSIPYGGITEVANNGTAIAPRLGFVSSTMSAPSSLAIDGSGNVWIANSGAGTVTVFVGAASPVVTPLAVGVKNGMLGTMP